MQLCGNLKFKGYLQFQSTSDVSLVGDLDRHHILKGAEALIVFGSVWLILGEAV